MVEIKSGGHVLGEVYTQKLSIEDGGVFEGRSSIQVASRPRKAAQPQAAKQWGWEELFKEEAVEGS